MKKKKKKLKKRIDFGLYNVTGFLRNSKKRQHSKLCLGAKFEEIRFRAESQKERDGQAISVESIFIPIWK